MATSSESLIHRTLVGNGAGATSIAISPHPTSPVSGRIGAPPPPDIYNRSDEGWKTVKALAAGSIMINLVQTQDSIDSMVGLFLAWLDRFAESKRAVPLDN
ncbi:hypothetical protein QR685DRAFT_496898 [Neurospora intermedia]|uniref:Uncharacterized protein n=1 Tax=Neurospora intermedia TaxID=5142 RepID=A0ABR3DER6_NEUIN